MKWSWPRLAVERLKLLKKWRELSSLVARAAREVIRDSLVAVYVVGSVVEDKVTVYSDIDIAVIVKDAKYKSIDTIIDIKLRAEELGLPLEAPVDIKVLTEEEFKSYLGTVYKKAVKVDTA